MFWSKQYVFSSQKRIELVYAIAFELNPVKVDLYGKKWSGRSSTTLLQTSEKHNFSVYTDKLPKMYTHVEQKFLCRAGLSSNTDFAVPSLKSENIAKNCFSIQGWRWVGTAGQSEAPIDFD